MLRRQNQIERDFNTNKGILFFNLEQTLLKGQRMVHYHLMSDNFKVTSMKIWKDLPQSCISAHSKYNAAQAEKYWRVQSFTLKHKKPAARGVSNCKKTNKNNSNKCWTRKLGINSPGWHQKVFSWSQIERRF